MKSIFSFWKIIYSFNKIFQKIIIVEMEIFLPQILIEDFLLLVQEMLYPQMVEFLIVIMEVQQIYGVILVGVLVMFLIFNFGFNFMLARDLISELIKFNLLSTILYVKLSFIFILKDWEKI